MQKLNEAALSSVLGDVTFIETEIKRLGKPDLDRVFDEIKLVSCATPSTVLWRQADTLDPQHRPLRRRIGIPRTIHSTRELRGGSPKSTRHHPAEDGEGAGRYADGAGAAKSGAEKEGGGSGSCAGQMRWRR